LGQNNSDEYNFGTISVGLLEIRRIAFCTKNLGESVARIFLCGQSEATAPRDCQNIVQEIFGRI